MIPLPDLTAGQVARFHAQVQRGGEGCWLWTGETTNHGHGRFVLYRSGRRLRLLAHRVAYFLAKGVDPGGDVVRHACDNPPCVNPAHLSTGTQQENILDARSRGRMNLTGLDAWRQRRSEAARDRLRTGIKTCRGCQAVKPLGEFSRHRDHPDGRQYRCKACARRCRSRRAA